MYTVSFYLAYLPVASKQTIKISRLFDTDDLWVCYVGFWESDRTTLGKSGNNFSGAGINLQFDAVLSLEFACKLLLVLQLSLQRFHIGPEWNKKILGLRC